MHGITLDKIISRKDVFASRVNDDLVVFDQESGQYFASGGVGADIWDLITTPMSVQEICRQLSDIYDVPADVCASEVQGFIEDLWKAGLVEVN